MHPEWQGKVCEEIYSAVDDERVVELADSPRLPTLRAVIKECFRWRPPLPTGKLPLHSLSIRTTQHLTSIYLGIPHEIEQDDAFTGYHIPKGALIHGIEWCISRNPIIPGSRLLPSGTTSLPVIPNNPPRTPYPVPNLTRTPWLRLRPSNLPWPASHRVRITHRPAPL
jgi:Cytochrome P450